MREPTGALELGREYPPPDEERSIREIEAQVRSKLERDYPRGVQARRGAHPKMHGCVFAEFVVEESLPEALRVGLFRVPRTYPAWVRFSNGSQSIQADGRRDARGMAMKLMDVPGEKVLEAERDETTHDFVMLDHPISFIRNAADYAEFSPLATRYSPAVALLLFFLRGILRFRWRFREARNLLALAKVIANPLGVRYWSQTPYRLGAQAIKFSAIPHQPAVLQGAPPDSPDFLREAMRRQLAEGEARFDFLVQLQVDPVRMPVEDPTVDWEERLSPFVKVATLRIPAQAFDTPERQAFGEHLSFTPWHALPEHQPLGGINRVRRVVYESLSRLRHELNGVPRSEPRELSG